MASLVDEVLVVLGLAVVDLLEEVDLVVLAAVVFEVEAGRAYGLAKS